MRRFVRQEVCHAGELRIWGILSLKTRQCPSEASGSQSPGKSLDSTEYRISPRRGPVDFRLHQKRRATMTSTMTKPSQGPKVRANQKQRKNLRKIPLPIHFNTGQHAMVILSLEPLHTCRFGNN